MKCPDCGKGLVERRMQGEVLDLCGACRGLWFDQGELPTVIEGLTHEVTGHDRPGAHRDRVPSAPPAPKGGCPRCGSALEQLNYALDSNIIVSRCADCRGVWVRRGQLRQLVLHLKGTPAEQRMGQALAKRARDKFENADHLSGRMGAVPGLGFMPICLLPVGDTAERQSFPKVVVGLILINVLVSALVFWSSHPAGIGTRWGLVPANGLGPRAWPTFVTNMFLHVGVLHLAGNMLFLWIFGDNIEDRLGSVWFAGFYLVCGVVGNLAHMASDPSSSTPAVGASGAIAGVMGAYFLCYPWARIKLLVFYRIYALPAWAYLGFWIAAQLINAAVVTWFGQDAQIAWWAHIGGFACGMVLALLFKRYHAHRVEPAQVRCV